MCELSQHIGKKKFSSTAKNRTNMSYGKKMKNYVMEQNRSSSPYGQSSMRLHRRSIETVISEFKQLYLSAQKSVSEIK